MKYWSGSSSSTTRCMPNAWHLSMENDPTTWLLLLHQTSQFAGLPAGEDVEAPSEDRRRSGEERSLCSAELRAIARGSALAGDGNHGNGGDASVCEASFIEGVTNRDVIQLFHAGREADYLQVLEEARGLDDELKAASVDAGVETASIASRLAKMRQRLTDIESIDFFSSPARKPVDSLLAQIETKLRKVPIRKAQQQGDYSGRTWVTRKGSTWSALHRPG